MWPASDSSASSRGPRADALEQERNSLRAALLRAESIRADIEGEHSRLRWEVQGLVMALRGEEVWHMSMRAPDAHLRA